MEQGIFLFVKVIKLNLGQVKSVASLCTLITNNVKLMLQSYVAFIDDVDSALNKFTIKMDITIESRNFYPRGGYSRTSGIYGCAALMGGFWKKLAPMMGAFWGIPALIMGTFLEILPKLGAKNSYFPSK